MHSKGICHRGSVFKYPTILNLLDIKPENVLLTSKDPKEAVAKLVDYGASAFFTSKRPFMKTYTGTLCYMAPEIIQGMKYTKAVDVWSLGVLS